MPAFSRDAVLTDRLLSYEPPLIPTPKPLAPPTGDITAIELKKYERIFHLQKDARWAEADQVIASLRDDRLKGYVWQQRYLHPTGYTSTYAELQRWMAQYADHAGADRIYALALRKKTAADHGALKTPQTASVTHRYIDLNRKPLPLYSGGTSRTFAQADAFEDVLERISDKIRNERPTQALMILNEEKRTLHMLDYYRLQSKISVSYMHEGKTGRALSLARDAVRHAGTKVPLAAWVAGLSSWRQNEYADAATYFEMVAGSPYANAWTRSGGAFWASRAHMRLGNFGSVSLWLNRAASEPRTFYGLVATRALSRSVNIDWSVPPLGVTETRLLTHSPSAVRGMALMKLGRFDDARYEFRSVELSDDPDIRRALIPVAEAIGAPGMAWRAASYLLYKNEMDVPVAAQYPRMALYADQDYRVDPALVHALMRQESRFNPQAGSPIGACGLMQLMPSTARHVMGDAVYEAAGGDDALFDPSFNLRTGQKYIHDLFKGYIPDRNLFDLLIAWNAGPGNLMRWKKTLTGIDDPLLFIETIPVAETRAFVERVMTNYWLYRNRFGQKTPSLDAVAEGRWPIYQNQE